MASFKTCTALMRVAALAMLLQASPAGAQADILSGFTQTVYIERIGAQGQRMIAPASTLKKGDSVIMVLTWPSAVAAHQRYARSAIPAALQYNGSSNDALEISPDGGRSWGQLGTIQVADKDGARLAGPEDVTHLRWQVKRGQAGRMTYRAFVR